MATGASGSFTCPTSSTYLGITTTVTWQQEFTPGDDHSTLHVSMEMVRNDSYGAQGGTWYANADGGIYVNGEKVAGWSNGESTYPYSGWVNSGDTGWAASGSVEIAGTDATTAEITVDSVKWRNSTYDSAGITISAKSETVSLEAVPSAYTLTIQKETGVNVTVSRNGGTLSNGATLYSGDVLTITASADAGYEYALTVNGETFTSGGTFTVTGNVTVSVSSKRQGLAYIGNEKYQAYIGDGASFDLYQPYVGADDGSKWILLS